MCCKYMEFFITSQIFAFFFANIYPILAFFKRNS